MSAGEWNAVALSLQVAFVATFVAVPFAIAAGYWLARSASRFRWLAETLLNLPLVVPPIVTGFALLMLFGRNGPLGMALEQYFGVRVAFTWLGAAVAQAIVGFPLMVRAIRLAFEGVPPRLTLAAQTLGAHPAQAFFRITLPLAMRGVVAGAVLGFARGLGEFGATVVIAGNIPGLTQTIPLAIFSDLQRADGMPAAYRLAAVSVALACGALMVSEWLERRGGRHERAQRRV